MRYINFCIKTLEPVKMGAQNISETTEYSLDYITGSAIRGAIINTFIQEYKVDLEKEKELKLCLLKKINFLNAYPKIDKIRAIPAPICFIGEKRVVSQYNGDAIDIVSVFEQNIQGYKTCKKEPFVLLEKNKIKGIKVKKQFYLHIGVNKKDNKKKTMFRYEAIEKGQEFIASILLQQDALFLEKQLRKLLENRIFYLGGSKGSGYGKCIVSLLECDNIGLEGGKPFRKEVIRDFYVYFLSDAILLQENGFIREFIDLNYLANILGVNSVKYKKGVIDIINITGYNSIWKASLPQIKGVKAGSIQHYRIEDEQIDENKIKKGFQELERKGVGDRKTDGFGRIMIINKPIQKKWERFYCNTLEPENIILQGEAKQQVEQMMKVLYKNKIIRGINKRIVQQASQINKLSITSTQIGKILSMTIAYQCESPEVIKEKFRLYFEHMKEKKNNLEASRGFSDTKIAKQSLESYIMEIIRHCDEREKFEKVEEFSPLPNIGGTNIELSKTEISYYYLLYLEKFFRYLRRMIAKGDNNEIYG